MRSRRAFPERGCRPHNTTQDTKFADRGGDGDRAPPPELRIHGRAAMRYGAFKTRPHHPRRGPRSRSSGGSGPRRDLSREPCDNKASPETAMFMVCQCRLSYAMTRIGAQADMHLAPCGIVPLRAARDGPGRDDSAATNSKATLVRMSQRPTTCTYVLCVPCAVLPAPAARYNRDRKASTWNTCPWPQWVRWPHRTRRRPTHAPRQLYT